MISYALILGIIQPWVGSAMLPYLEETAQSILTRFSYFGAKDDLDGLNAWLEAYLYDSVRRITRGKMIAGLDDGSLVSLRAADFTVIADEIMYLLFSSFPKNPKYLLMLRDYSLRHESLSALRALLIDFRGLISEEESIMIRKVVLNYPAWRYKNWLNQSSGEA